MKKLTDTQRRALVIVTKGPLFRGHRGNWSRADAGPIGDKTVRTLLEMGLVDRDHARNGAPMVRITHYGRKALGLETAAERAAREAALRHGRIAP